ncbi:MAG TPA: choice-of-anchor D domain-containing protein [Candidatus Solibacter sp.]|nr:choice-of-anchor D domain-containing protein [Candidatus Solibacter sp.]
MAQPHSSGAANVGVSLEVSPSTIAPGEIAALYGYLYNNGPDVPQDTVAAIAIPKGLKAQSCSTAAGNSCTVSAATVTVDAPNLYGGIQFSIALKAADNLVPPCPPGTPQALCVYGVTLTIQGSATSDLPAQYQQPPAVATLVVGLPISTAPAQMTVSASRLNFGYQFLATYGTAQTVSITNAGTVAVSLEGQLVEGDFLEASNSCLPNRILTPDAIATMPPGATCTIGISFFPQQLGTSSGKLVFTEFPLNSLAPAIGQQVIDLHGTGNAIQLTGPVAIQGMVLLGTTFQMYAYVTNYGPVPANVTSVRVEGSDFSLVEDGCTGQLAAHANCAIVVAFTPSEASVRKGRVIVTDDDPTSPQSAPLRGTGTAIQVVMPNGESYPLEIGFGYAYLGVSTPPSVVTVRNVSGKSVPFDGIETSPDFHERDNCPGKLAAGAACEIRVWLRAPANGEYAGSLTIFDQDPASPQTVNLSGTGVGIKRDKIFVHYDYMVATDHTHDPEVVAPGAIQVVIDSFAAHGVELVVDPVHAAIPEVPFIDFDSGGQACGTPDTHVAFEALRAAYFTPTRASEHYMVFGHDNTLGCFPLGSSGVADLPGLNFVVTLGREQGFPQSAANFVSWVAGTFMHELGHNLGLHHGGNGDDTNWKPHFTSIMNYNYQFIGIVQAEAPASTVFKLCHADPDCPPLSRCLGPASGGNCRRIDYSTQLLPAGGATPGVLDENDLDETAGLGSGNNDIVYFSDGMCDVGYGFGVAGSQGPIDWEGDGAATNPHAQVDVIAPWWAGQGIYCPTGIYLKLGGGNDWGFLQPAGQPASVAGAEKAVEEPRNGEQATAPVDPDDIPAPTSRRQRPPTSGPELSLDEAQQRHALHAPINAAIRVSPSCAQAEKPVAPGTKGLLNLAILGTPNLEVNEIDPTSLRMHGASPVRTQILDVDGDGRPDLVATFEMSAIRLHPSAKRIRLSGWLKNSRLFFGEDRIRVVGSMAAENAACR